MWGHNTAYVPTERASYEAPFLAEVNAGKYGGAVRGKPINAPDMKRLFLSFMADLSADDSHQRTSEASDPRDNNSERPAGC